MITSWMKEINIGKNSRTMSSREVIRFDQLKKIIRLRAQKVDRIGLPGSRVRKVAQEGGRQGPSPLAWVRKVAQPSPARFAPGATISAASYPPPPQRSSRSVAGRPWRTHQG